MSGGSWLGPEASAQRVFDAYVPRVVLHHLAREPFEAVRTVPGTMMFADLSGFTRLSERLQRRGPEGAELLVATVNGVFTDLLRIAYDNGGSLIKFGGDALLIFFDGPGHPARAAHAAVRMREALRIAGRLDVAGVRAGLRMTVGLHTDEFHFVLVGDSHREHLVLGSGARGTVETEALARNGRIAVSAATAALLPAGVVGAPVGATGARLLRRSPATADAAPAETVPRLPAELVGQALSTVVRAHVLDGRATPEHRRACVAFLQFGGTNALIADEGIDDAAAEVHALVAQTQRAADSFDVCFLDSDIGADGGTLLLTAGAPRVVGDDEERMLLTLRQILDGRTPGQRRRLPIRIGVNRGPVFTGEIGPHYRRSYIVMGDTTNLAARVANRAGWGALWATPGILERSTTRFHAVALEPFTAKGKTRPVQAYEVGAAQRSAAGPLERAGAPLVGRAAESAVLATALAALERGTGSVVEVLGDAGVGKSALLADLVARAEQAGGVHPTGITCEAHGAATPYGPWSALLPGLLGLPPTADRYAAFAVAAARCAADPDLAPWISLLADTFGIEVAPGPEVAALSPEYRRTRLHEVLFRFLEPQLRRPTLITVDNAQHLDEASRAVFEALADRVADAPWLVVTAARPTPGTAAARAGVARLALAPLAPEDALRLAEDVTDVAPLPPHLLREAVDRSGGNPQFLLDLLAAAGGGTPELPDSAQAAAMAVIDALAPGDRALVRRLSVLGTSFRPDQVPVVAPVGSGGDLLARLGAVFTTGDGGRIAFRRTTVQEAAYAGLPFGERRALHAAIAAALAAETTGPDATVLARHHLLAGAHAAALPHLRTAAQRSLERGAPADAARLFRDALTAARQLGLDDAELVGLHDGLGLALRRCGQGRAADQAYRDARRCAGGDPVRAAEFHYLQARLAHREGRYPASVRAARAGRRTLDGAGGAQARAWRARLLSSEAADRLRQGRLREAIALCRSAMAEAEHGTSPVAERALAHACYLLDWSLVESGRAGEAVHSARAQEIYIRLGDLEDLANVRNNQGMFAYWDGRWDDAVRHYRAAAELSERIGDVMGVGFGDCNIGEVLADQGHWDAAEQSLTRALRAWRSCGDEAGGAFARMLLGRLQARRGRGIEGVRILEAAATELAADALDADDAVLARCYLAEAVQLAGRPADALAAVGAVEPVAPARQRALLLRVRALAAGPSVPGLVEALQVAREIGADHDAATTAHALCALGADPGGEFAAVRDDIGKRLGLVAYPPLGQGY